MMNTYIKVPWNRTNTSEPNYKLINLRAIEVIFTKETDDPERPYEIHLRPIADPAPYLLKYTNKEKRDEYFNKLIDNLTLDLL